jgi:energy-converting hydrogenase Eha subunit G
MSRIGFSGVFSTPNPWIICIVSHGEGYLVDVNHPSEYQEIDAIGITNVFPILELEMIIFITVINLVSYGPEGKTWETKRFGNGEILVTDANKRGISGTYWKPEINGYPEFYVNPVTGECKLFDS